jgi:protein phosphatase 1 regulatory subunit 10
MDSMYPNVPNQWPQNVTDAQHVQVDGSSPSNDDWKDQAAPNGSTGASGGISGTAQPSLDLSDFGLGDIPGKHLFKRPYSTCCSADGLAIEYPKLHC